VGTSETVDNQRPPLNAAAIRKIIGPLQVTQCVEVEWSMHDEPIQTSIGRCVMRDLNCAHIHYNDLGHEPLPLPPTSTDVVVYAINIRPLTDMPMRPINLSNRDIPVDPRFIAYIDGGSRPNPGPSGAGIHVYEKLPCGRVVERRHGKFYSATTNNAAELASMVAVLRLIHRMYPGEGVIYMDSKLAFDALTGTLSVKQKGLVDLAKIARDLYLTMVGRVTLVHMLRTFGNPGDAVATECINTAADIGASELFPDCPVVLPSSRRRPAAPTLVEPKPPACLDINTVDDFIKLRDFKTRGSVPPQAYAQWGTIVARQLAAILTADTAEKRDRFIIELLALPSRYLPARSSSARVVQHLSACRPFNIELKSRAQRARDQDDAVQRLAEAVHRNAMDFRLRSANKLISQGVGGDMPFDEKQAKLKAKLVPKDPDDADDPAIGFEDVPSISGKELMTALKSINRQCATSIDGWTKDIVVAAIKGAPDVAEQLSAVLHIILSQPLSPLLSEIMRLARLVGLPKANNGIRPIAISSIWMKLLGTIALHRDAIKPSRRQFAVGRKDGCLQIVHEIRAELDSLNADVADDQYVVLKFDASNAFNSLKRKHLRKCMRDHSATARQYFRLCYEAASTLAVFGPGDFVKLDMEDGVRQGDSTSSYMFCIGVDQPLEELIGMGYLCWMYCDDLTIIAKRSEVDKCVQDVAAAFAKVGLQINEEKTEVYDPTLPRNEPFVVLGIDLANTRAFFDEKIAKAKVYFDTIDRLPLHPQLKTVLLRLCGAPKLLYLLKGMAPQFTENIAKTFDDMVRSSLAKSLGLKDVGELPLKKVHHTSGAGIPNLCSVREILYRSCKAFALEHIRSDVELVPSDPTALSSPSARHNLDGSWLWYHDAMSPSEFIAAYCVRLGFVPSNLRLWPIKCHCGTMITNDSQQIDHTFRCDRFTKVTHATRHNMVRDSMARVAMQYGISTIKEPTMYTYVAGRKRPDLLFQTSTPIATDITIVMPGDVPMDAAHAADEQKCKTHIDAVKSLGHVFIPAAAEAYGLLGKGFTKLIDELLRDLAPQYQWGFKNEFTRAITTAMARSRASALYGSKWHMSSSIFAPF
jgi:hypothetical protein